MKASNLALWQEPAEDQPEPPPARRQLALPAAPEPAPMRPRARRPFAFRTIVIRDQGLRLFRCG